MASVFGIIPQDWLEDLGGFLGSLLDPIVSWATGWAKALWNDTLQGLNVVAQDAALYTDRAIQALGDVTNLIATVENDVLTWVENEVSTLVNDAIDVAVTGFNDLVNEAESLASDAENIANQALNDVENIGSDILHQAENLVNAGVTDAENIASAALSAFERDVVDPVVNELRTLEGDVAPILNIAWSDVLNVVHLVLAVAGWLEWLAKLPFDAVNAVLQTLEGRITYDNMKGGSDAAIANFSAIADGVAAVIG